MILGESTAVENALQIIVKISRKTMLGLTNTILIVAFEIIIIINT